MPPLGAALAREASPEEIPRGPTTTHAGGAKTADIVAAPPREGVSGRCFRNGFRCRSCGPKPIVSVRVRSHVQEGVSGKPPTRHRRRTRSLPDLGFLQRAGHHTCGGPVPRWGERGLERGREPGGLRRRAVPVGGGAAAEEKARRSLGCDSATDWRARRGPRRAGGTRPVSRPGSGAPRARTSCPFGFGSLLGRAEGDTTPKPTNRPPCPAGAVPAPQAGTSIPVRPTPRNGKRN